MAHSSLAPLDVAIRRGGRFMYASLAGPMKRPSRPAQPRNDSNQQQHHPPKPAQLQLLRVLAERTGRSFSQPTTRAAATAEIRRLQRAERTGDEERTAEAQSVSSALSAGPASSVQDHELEGFGSTARYATGHRQPLSDDRARGDEHCRGIRTFPSPYYHGHKDSRGKTMSRADARRAYAAMLWRLIQTQGAPVIARLAALDGTLTSCCCRIHPCQRETLADAAAWAARQLD